MSKPFDATMKEVLAISPTAWPRFLGYSVEKAEVINSDIATVTSAVDFVIRVEAPERLHHLEFQAGPDAEKPQAINVANGLLERKHQCPVRSSLILLRKEAWLSSYTGRYEMRFDPHSPPYRTFEYDVIKLWELDRETFLNGDVALLPLVPLTQLEARDIPEVFEAITERLSPVEDPSLQGVLWSATDILTRMRFGPSFVKEIMMSDVDFGHSDFYLELMRVANLEIQKKVIRSQGEAKFGQAPEVIQNRLETMTEVDELEAMTIRLLTVNSWEELFAPPKKKPTRKKRK